MSVEDQEDFTFDLNVSTVGDKNAPPTRPTTAATTAATTQTAAEARVPTQQPPPQQSPAQHSTREATPPPSHTPGDNTSSRHQRTSTSMASSTRQLHAVMPPPVAQSTPLKSRAAALLAESQVRRPYLCLMLDVLI